MLTTDLRRRTTSARRSHLLDPVRRGTAILAVAAGLLFAAATVPVAAQEASTMTLFKLITPKDEIVIGLSGDELRSFGNAPDLDNLAARLAAAGQMTVWQYAVRKGADGELQQAPLRRVAVFKTDTLRIEPYNPVPLKIVSPDKP
jgi:hypothetical protein